MKFSRFRILVRNTLHKEYRNRTLIFLLVISLLIIWGSTEFMHRIETTSSLWAMSTAYWWTTIVAALLGVNSIRSDIDAKVLPQVMSFPIRRSGYVTARITGTWIISVAYFLLCTAIFIFRGMVQPGTDILLFFLVSSAAILVVITLGMMFSLILPKLVAFIFVLMSTGFISQANMYVSELPHDAIFSDPGVFKGIAVSVHYLVPRIGIIRELSLDILANGQTAMPPIAGIFHFILSFLLMYALTVWILRSRVS